MLPHHIGLACQNIEELRAGLGKRGPELTTECRGNLEVRGNSRTCAGFDVDEGKPTTLVPEALRNETAPALCTGVRPCALAPDQHSTTSTATNEAIDITPAPLTR